MKKALLVLAAVFVGFFICCFALLFIHGSLDAFPTPEQIESARIAYGLVLIMLIAAEVVLTVNILRRKK